MGDVIAGLGIVFVLVEVLGLGIQAFAALNVGLAALWLLLRSARQAARYGSWRRRRTRSARRWPLSAMAPHDDQRARPGSRRSVR